jgi:hypothetical protein
VRIDCSLCGVKKHDLDFCLSASVNVRYILHTQPLRFIYNKILVWVSLYPPFIGLSFSPSTPFATVACYSFTSPSSSFSISSTLTLPMAKDEICNTNGHGDNNAIDPPTEGTPLLGKMKHDASKTLGKQTKKEMRHP